MRSDLALRRELSDTALPVAMYFRSGATVMANRVHQYGEVALDDKLSRPVSTNVVNVKLGTHSKRHCEGHRSAPFCGMARHCLSQCRIRLDLALRRERSGLALPIAMYFRYGATMFCELYVAK